MVAFKKYRQLFKRSLGSNDQLATVLAKVLMRMRNLFVAFFDRIYNRLSPSSKKFSLMFFCLLAGGLSIYQILKAFNNKDNALPKAVSIKAASRHFQKPGDDVQVENNIVTKAEYKRLQVFESYIDSLSKSKTGYVIYDSILHSRPGLMDSVQELINLYESQLKKEK